MSDVQQSRVAALHLQTTLSGDLQLFAATTVLPGPFDVHVYAWLMSMGVAKWQPA